MKLLMKKSKIDKKPVGQQSAAPDDKLEYFRKLLLDHLDTLKDGPMEKGGKGLPVGTIRDRKNGKKYVKIAPGKWRPKYESQTRGAKMAVAAIRKKVSAAKDAHEMMQIVLENHDRFSDKDGHPLPFVQDLSQYVAEQQDVSNSKTVAKKEAGKKEGGKLGMKRLKSVYVNFTDKNGIPQITHLSVGENENVQDVLEHFEPGAKMDSVHEDRNEAREAHDTANEAYNEKNKKQTPGNSPIKEDPTKGWAAQSAREVMPGRTFEDINAMQHGKQPKSTRSRSEDMRGNQSAKKDGGAGDDESWKKRISGWLSKENLAKAEGKTRDEIFSIFGKELEPIAEISNFYLKYLGDGLTDNKIYTSEGYFVDHAVNHHPEVDGSEYTNIPDILRNPDDVKLDDKNGERNSLIFIKKIDKQEVVIVSVYETDSGKLAFHKSFFTSKKIPYKSLRSVRDTSLSGATSDISQADNSAPAGNRLSGRNDTSLLAEFPEKSTPETGNFDQIRQKYQSSTVIEGDEDEINVNGELIPGKWKLVEADAPSASHDERTFHKTEDFPETDEGATVNDRDYEHDKAAQETVIDVAGDYDSRALSVDNPVIVTPDGVVISGNNRTMSSKIAARKGTDTKYIEALKKRAKKFGLSEADIGKFKNPRVVFETDTGGKYDTETFSKFNVTDKKAMSPLETAVKVSKRITPETVGSVATTIAEYETLGELYANGKAIGKIFEGLVKSGLINKMDLPQYYADGNITEAGKEFFETAMIGSVVNENNIRKLNKAGGKQIRAKLVRAIVPLVENKSLGGYSINKELNEAVDIVIQAVTDKNIATVDNFAKQENFFEGHDRVAIELAKKLEGTQKGFAEFMQTMNGGLRPAANGEMDIFLGGAETKEDVVSRILGLKKSIGKAVRGALKFFHRLRKGHGTFERKKVILNRAGETVEQYRWVIGAPMPPDGTPELTPETSHPMPPIQLSPDYEEKSGEKTIEKSLTYSGHPLQGRAKVQGMDISIENEKGSTRSGTDKNGKPWSQKMGWSYGYIRGTVGKDKDHVDCFIGPNPESEKVFVIHQVDPFTEGNPFDEDKVMIGWDDAEDAKKAYISQYNRPDFFGSMDIMDIDTFKEKAYSEKYRGKMIKCLAV